MTTQVWLLDEVGCKVLIGCEANFTSRQRKDSDENTLREKVLMANEIPGEPTLFYRALNSDSFKPFAGS